LLGSRDTVITYSNARNFKNKGGKKDMKKGLITLFAVVFVTSMCFAEDISVLSSVSNSANSTKTSNNTAAPAQVPSAAASTSTAIPAQVSSAAVVSTSTTILSPVGTTNFTGKVDSVLSGSGISGTNPQIIVKDDKGHRKTFMVSSDATIIGKDGNTTTLTWVDKDDNVSIEYVTDKDGSTAKSIKVSSDW
jgi:hypothetical protein